MMPWLGVVLGAAAVALTLWLLLDHLARGAAWRSALKNIAQSRKLTYLAPEGAVSKTSDTVWGNDGLFRVSLGTHTRSRSTSKGTTTTTFAKIEVFGETKLCLCLPGKAKSAPIDYANPDDDSPTPIGVPDFDAAVELRKGSDALRKALADDGTLREQILGLVRDGMKIEDGRLVLVFTFPKDPRGVEHRYERAHALAERLAELA